MMKRGVCFTLALLAGAAQADGSVGVVVSGDATLQAGISAEIATWLQQHGRRVDAGALPAEAINGLIDCFVLEDPSCAQQIVQTHARTESIVYARVDARGTGPSRTVTISAYWVAKDGEPRAQKTECQSCTDDALRITADAMLHSLAAPAAATTTSIKQESAPVAVATTSESPRQPSGLALGAELGEPTSATIGWFSGPVALLAAVGTGTREGPGLSIHADAQLVVARVRSDVPVRIGLGGRFYHHGYQPMSIDEIPHEHFGIRAMAAVAFERGAMQLYAEAAPGLDLKRTSSCALTEGPRSVCPHAQDSPLFLQLVVGARWFLSH